MKIQAKTARNPMRGTRRAKRSVKVTTAVPVLPMKPVAKAQVQDLVKRAIDKAVENKFASIAIANTTAVPAGGVLPGSILNVVPKVPRGDDSWARNGSSIRVKQLVIKGHVAIKVNENRALRPLVRIMVFSSKQAKSYNAVFNIGTATIANQILDYGSGGTGTYNGTPLSACFPMNRKALNVHFDKQVRLTNSFATGVNAEASDEPYRFYKFSIKVKTPATFRYDDSIPAGPGTDLPQNFAPLMAVSYCYPDQTTEPADEAPLIYTAVSQLYYEDA